MFPAHIEEYLRPSTVADALAALARHDDGEAMFIAGGQSLMQAIKSRMARPRCLIDLQAIAELKGFRFDGGVRIGAMTRYVEIAQEERLGNGLAALRDAAAHVGDRQVRNRGTIGGSCCWNYVASCTPAVVLGLDGTMELVAASGARRSVPAREFLIGPLETARAPDEILEGLRFAPPPPRAGSAYRKWGLVKDALPVVGLCVYVELDAGGVCTAARIALSGLPAGAQLAAAGVEHLVGTRGEHDALARAFGALADDVEAQSDKWASEAYRRQLIRTLGAEVAAAAFARAAG
jgi:carbon-monoxide dehydrogenase medium subunit